ncbi:MAG: restriction endonuclease subunit S [bacterium]
MTGKTPPTADAANFDGPYPFITIPDLDGRRVIDRAGRTLSKKGAEAMRSCLLPPGAVMMSCIATVGKCGVTAKPSFTNQQINSVIPSDKTESGFLYYVFAQLGHELESAGGGGSVYTNVSKSRFSDIEISLPDDVNEQRAIAHILGTLDDKIELNRRMNETVEAMARAMFESWFVNFHPVRAKMEGRWRLGQSFAGLPAHLYDLFPDRLEDSELGEIPRGWNVRSIGEVVRCVGGSTPSTEEPKYWEGGTNPFVTPKDMSSLTSPVILGTERQMTDAGLERISSGRLPVGTVLLSSRAPIGYLAITEVPASVNQGIIAMICEGELPKHYVLRWVETNMEIIKANAGGTTFAEINKRNFRPIPVIVPPQKTLSGFVQQVQPLHQRIVMNVKETKILAGLRDALLPKLISGEIRLRSR